MKKFVSEGGGRESNPPRAPRGLIGTHIGLPHLPTASAQPPSAASHAQEKPLRLAVLASGHG